MNPWEELINRSNQWSFLEHSPVLGQVLVTDRRYRNESDLIPVSLTCLPGFPGCFQEPLTRK